MRRPSAHAATVVAWSLVLVAFGVMCRADDLSAAPSTIRDGEIGCLILHDGGVLEGQISRTADWYVVSRSGGQMQIASSRVQYVCHDLNEAYEYRRKRMVQPSGDTHLALADWCVRYQLRAEAEVELQNARRLGANPFKLELLERRLASTKPRPAQLATQGATMAVVATAPSGAAKPLAPAVVPDLPTGVVEQFTRRVQPILVNSCTAARCHQTGGNESFQLNRAVLRGESNRRTTMQNLAATLALIDREHPETSALLTIPRKTHGGMTAPVFGPRQEQAFRHLADWVALVAPAPPADQPATLDAEMIATAEPMGVARRRAARSATPSTTAYAQPLPKSGQPPAKDLNVATAAAPVIQDAAVRPATATDGLDELTTLRAPHRLQYGGTLETWQPRDPFDPEIFNRLERTKPRAIESPVK